MNKKVFSIFIINIVFLFITFALLIFLKIDNYESGVLLQNSQDTIIFINQNTYNFLKDQKYINFSIKKQKYKSKINEIDIYNSYYYCLIDTISGVDSEILNIMIQTTQNSILHF